MPSAPRGRACRNRRQHRRSPGRGARRHRPAGHVYASTVGQFLTDFSALPPSAFGNPADAIARVMEMPEPPPRLAVGADALEGAELDRWAA
jgi:hypothetical protein